MVRPVGGGRGAAVAKSVGLTIFQYITLSSITLIHLSVHPTQAYDRTGRRDLQPDEANYGKIVTSITRYIKMLIAIM